MEASGHFLQITIGTFSMVLRSHRCFSGSLIPVIILLVKLILKPVTLLIYLSKFITSKQNTSKQKIDVSVISSIL